MILDACMLRYEKKCWNIFGQKMRSYISFESEATFPWVGSGILSGWSDRFAGRSTLHTGFHLSSWTDVVVRGALTAEWWSEFGAGCELSGDHGGAEGAWSTSASKWGAGGSWARWGNCLKMFMLWILWVFVLKVKNLLRFRLLELELPRN